MVTMGTTDRKDEKLRGASLPIPVAGILRVKMDDGSEFDCKPGDISLLPSGHDAWVVGNKPAVVVDFQGMVDFAKERHT